MVVGEDLVGHRMGDFLVTNMNFYASLCFSVVCPSVVCCPLTNISRDAISLYLGISVKLYETILCERALLKGYQGQRSKVKVMCVNTDTAEACIADGVEAHTLISNVKAKHI